MLPADPGPRHRAIAADFTTVAEGVLDWDVPAPVAGWTSRHVVGHLVSWLPAFVAAGSDLGWAAGPSVEEDPVGAWRAQVDGVQALLDDPTIAATVFTHPMLPARPLGEAIDAYYTSDVFMHTWDLAAATGQPVTLDPDTCAMLLDGMQRMEEVLRSSGQFGPPVEVVAGADAQTRLLGFIGRNPSWHRS